MKPADHLRPVTNVADPRDEEVSSRLKQVERREEPQEEADMGAPPPGFERQERKPPEEQVEQRPRRREQLPTPFCQGGLIALEMDRGEHERPSPGEHAGHAMA